MKKSLLNNKSLNYAFLLFLLCANSIYSQTVFEETFGTTAVPAASNYSGGTSTPSVSYTTNVTGYTSIATDANNTGLLNFTSTGTAKRVSVAGALPTGTGLNGVLHSNTNLITWTFNMKASRLSTNTFSSSSGYPENKYFSAVVLCATNSSLLSNSPTPGTGYAVTVQKSTNNGTSGKASINLIKFSNGIGDVAIESSVVTRLIESPELAQIPTSVTTSNNLSIKITYNPTIDVWELFYREDPILPTPIGFVDPTSGTLSLGGSATDVPTLTAMTHFGYAVGLQANTGASNSYQFDNFKIGLSTPPAYTAPPTTEKRQAFNSTPTPIVANLVAAGINGGIFKWYDALTGGNLLSSSAPLTYANYYVSQTVNGTESTRVASQVFVGDTALKTLPFYEGFANYNIADKLILMNNGASSALPANQGTGLGSWTITPGTNITDDVTIVASPTWPTSVLPVASGNAITFVGSGIDPELKFTNTTSGNLYSSFLFTATDAASINTAQAAADALAVAAGLPTPVTLPSGIDPAKSTPTGIYSFLSETTDSGTGIVTTGYSSDVMFRKVFGTTTNTFNIGLSKSNNGEECTWSTTEFQFGTPYLIMISYENIGDADALNQVANLWINPTTTTLPIPVPTLTQNNPTTSVSRDHIDRIKILQASSSSTPLTIIDEIRVANNWGQALGAAATMGITSVKTSGLKMYPNPVSNGKLYISSASNLEKEVLIFNTLGQQVLQAKTITEAINVSNLNKGTYFVKITEAGITATKKLIIQ
ncbi:Secretion system C-terminal sorting domain [Flavobacteriaceae bacterium]